MKLSMFLTLSLFAYSSVQASRANRDQLYPPPGVPKVIFEQQQREFDHWKKIKIAQLCDKEQKLARKVKECKRIMSLSVEQFEYSYHPDLEENLKSAWNKIYGCLKTLEEKVVIGKERYNKEHE
jgi:hypothetical protein